MDKKSDQKLKSALFNYFKTTPDGKFYECQCYTKEGDTEQMCNAQFTACKTSNLKRHLHRNHPQILDEVNKAGMKRKIDTPSSSSNLIQLGLSEFYNSDKITVTMTAEIFKGALIKMVVQNSIPISFFSQPTFFELNGEMASKLKVSLGRESIRKLIIDEAANRRSQLIKNLQGCLVFIKMDGCTRHRVNYVAINVRFVKNKEIITQTLAIKDTQAHHSSEYLKNILKEILKDFKIKKEHVLCIVTDNASNMLSITDKLNKENKEALVTVDDFNLTELSVEQNGEDLDNICEEASNLFFIQHMRCAVHTFQLSIRDGLKNHDATTIILKLRQIAVAARNPKIDAILHRRAGKGAVLDQATRWGSTYDMIKRLLELKTFFADMDNPNLSLTETQWEQATTLENILYRPYILTKKLQTEDLTPGAFFFEWRNLIYQLSSNDDPISSAITSSMNKREQLLLQNEILVAAIYIDPMSRILLNDNQITKAKGTLYEIALRMKCFSEVENLETQIEHTYFASSKDSTSSSSHEDSSFEKYLNELSVIKRKRFNEKKPVDTNKQKFKKEFFAALEEVEKYDRSSQLNVQEAIDVYPEIVENAARIVTALPPTQVSVERLFSALKIIKSDLRASLKDDLIEAILFLRNIV